MQNCEFRSISEVSQYTVEEISAIFLTVNDHFVVDVNFIRFNLLSSDVSMKKVFVEISLSMTSKHKKISGKNIFTSCQALHVRMSN